MNYQYLIYAGHTSYTRFISHSLSSLSILDFSWWNNVERKIAYHISAIQVDTWKDEGRQICRALPSATMVLKR